MTDDHGTNGSRDERDDAGASASASNAGTGGGAESPPERVGGTPPPAESRYLLAGAEGDASGGGSEKQRREPSPEEKRSERRIERVVAFLFVLAFVGGVGLIASYAAFQVHSIQNVRTSNLFLGGSLTLVFLALAVGVTIWVRRLMTYPEITEERKQLASPPEEKQQFVEYFMTGTEETGVTKRPLLRRTLLIAMVPLGLAPVVLLRDLGPLPRERLRHTTWEQGKRLVVEGTERPIRAVDLSEPDSYITVVPEGTEHDLEALAKATVMIINIPPSELRLPSDRMNWTVNGIIAYSKICTHVGCPAGLYDDQTREILCPCHQSTFDATNGAEVIFGPATRPLPQLPITVDDEGYLVAQSDFHEPVGPSFWERG